MISIFRKELSQFFNSFIAYIVMVVFLISIGLFMWVFPEYSVLDYGFADMSTLFTMAPFVFMFLIPAITMRTFAEEKRDGTIEFLLTKPISDWQLILGKFFSSFILVVFALLPTLVYYYSISLLGDPEGNIDSAAVAGSYIGLLFLGAVFTSLGIFSSSISNNQIVAFILAFFLCFLVYQGFYYLSTLKVWETYSSIVDQLGIQYHYDSLSKGLIDSRDVVYFISIIVIMLLSTRLVIGSRKW